MCAARGDTKHYSKSIQPLGLCAVRWLTGSSGPPSLIKGRAEALSFPRLSKACFCILCNMDQQRQAEFGCTVKGSESPSGILLHWVQLFIPATETLRQRARCKVILIINTSYAKTRGCFIICILTGSTVIKAKPESL